MLEVKTPGNGRKFESRWYYRIFKEVVYYVVIFSTNTTKEKQKSE